MRSSRSINFLLHFLSFLRSLANEAEQFRNFYSIRYLDEKGKKKSEVTFYIFQRFDNQLFDRGRKPNEKLLPGLKYASNQVDMEICIIRCYESMLRLFVDGNHRSALVNNMK